MLDSRSTTRALALALTASAIAAPAAIAMPRLDVVSNRDAIEAGLMQWRSSTAVDARHQALVQAHRTRLQADQPVARDLRSPDTRDIAAGRGPSTVFAPPARVVRVSASDGLDWGDAAIGAGTAIALTLVGGGAALAASRRRVHVQVRPQVN
jgi:hypothetical protein